MVLAEAESAVMAEEQVCNRGGIGSIDGEAEPYVVPVAELGGSVKEQRRRTQWKQRVLRSWRKPHMVAVTAAAVEGLRCEWCKLQQQCMLVVARCASALLMVTEATLAESAAAASPAAALWETRKVCKQHRET